MLDSSRVLTTKHPALKNSRLVRENAGTQGSHKPGLAERMRRTLSHSQSERESQREGVGEKLVFVITSVSS